MLLYDRVLENGMKTWKTCGDDDFGSANVHRMKCLAECQVFELTDVAKLFPDWKRERDKKVPRTPPFENLWAEWRTDYDDLNGLRLDITIGCVVSRCTDADIKIHKTDGTVRDLLGSADRVYSTQVFRHVHKIHACYEDDPATRARVMPVLEASSKAGAQADCDLNFWTLNEAGTDLDVFHCASSKKEKFQKLAEENKRGELPICETVLGLPMLTLRVGSHSTNQLWSPWPVWMAFALLHCRNVVTDTHEPDPKIQKQVARHGNPPRATYKTLRVQVPHSFRKHVAGSTEGGDDGPKVRFHVCSGHFKNLQHERFKEKGLVWWNAHWRGNKQLGEVHTRRRLQPSQSSL